MWRRGIIYVLLVIITFAFVASEKQANDELTLADMNHKLLNQLVFEAINQLRIKKDKKPLENKPILAQLSDEYQSKYEFRHFNNSDIIERKIDKDLYDKAKNKGFTGGLLKPIATQYYAVDYDDGKEFFFDKNDKKTELHLFYGPRSKSKRKEANIIPMPHHTYASFAQKIIQNLSSEHRKQLINSSYKWVGVHLQWDYKSLYKNHRIPKIKAIILLGGYQTALMRD